MAVKTGTFAFEGFRLDPANALLWRGDDRVVLAPKPFQGHCHVAIGLDCESAWNKGSDAILVQSVICHATPINLA